MNVTEAIEELCGQLGVEPVWARLNESPPTALMIRFTVLAAEMAAGVDLGNLQQEGIGHLLDGNGDPRWASTFARLAMETAHRRDHAVDAARTILGDLIAAGLVR